MGACARSGRKTGCVRVAAQLHRRAGCPRVIAPCTLCGYSRAAVPTPALSVKADLWTLILTHCLANNWSSKS
jgi:hypothetical protein